MAPLPALDIRQQCAGFAYGLQVVDALVRSGLARHVLLVGTDVHSSLMPLSARSWEVLLGHDAGPLDAAELEWNSRFRHLVVLFGDAAGAMVFRAEEDSGRGSSAPRSTATAGTRRSSTSPASARRGVRSSLPSRSRPPRRCR